MKTIDDFVFFEDRKTLEPILNSYETNKNILTKITNSHISENEIVSLSELVPHIESGLKTIEKYSGVDLDEINVSLPQIIQKITNLEALFLSALDHTIQNLEASFTYNEKELKKASVAKLYDESKANRVTLDNLALLYSLLSDKVLSNNLFNDYSSQKIQEYLINIEQREKILEKLEFIKKKYKTLNWTETSQSLLKSFIDGKKGFLGLFKQEPLYGVTLDELIKGLNKINYYEGVEEASELKSEIRYAIENFTEILNIKKSISNTIKNEQTYISSVKKSSEKMTETYPILDKTNLSGMLQTHTTFQSKDFRNVKDMILFSEIIKPYYESRQRILNNIQTELTLHAKKYNNAFESLKKDSSSNSFLNNYESFIRAVPDSIYIGPKDRWLSEIADFKESIHQKEEETRKRRTEKQQVPASVGSSPEPTKLPESEAKAILDSLPDKISQGLAPVTANLSEIKKENRVTNERIDSLDQKITQLNRNAEQAFPNNLQSTQPGFGQSYIPRLGENRMDYYSTVPGKPPIKTCGDFLIMSYLSYIDTNTNYLWAEWALKEGWDSSLPKLKDRFSQGQAANIKDYDYVQHILYALGESRNRGEMTSRHSRSTEFRQLVDSTLITISDYLVRSEIHQGLSPKQIEDHRAVYGRDNQYNKELCISL
jgi:hypothetical protein